MVKGAQLSVRAKKRSSKKTALLGVMVPSKCYVNFLMHVAYVSIGFIKGFKMAPCFWLCVPYMSLNKALNAGTQPLSHRFT